MTIQIDQDILRAGVKKAQERIAEIDNSAVQPIPGNIATPPSKAIFPGTLTGLRGIAKRPGSASNDDDLQAEYTNDLTQKY